MSTVKTRKNTHAATQALWRIAETDDTHHVESILADGADINASNAHGMTALMRAASHGQIRMVRVLLKHGADPNISRSDKFTPLLLASFFGHEEVVRVLVEHGADPSAATRFGTSAQMWAAARTFHDVVDYLEKPRTVCRLSKEPAVEASRSQAQTGGNVSSVRFMPPFRPTNRRMVVYSVTTLLLVVAVIAGLTWRRQRSLNQMGSQTHPTVAVDGIVVTTSSAAENLGGAGAKAIAPSDAQVDTLAEGNDANDVNNHYRGPENVTGENKSKSPLVTRTVVSTSYSRKGKQLNRVANVNEPGSIPAVRPEDVRNRELPSVAASTAKPQPAVSRVATPMNGPAPLTTQLISPSKSSPPKGRTIQWP